VSGAAAAPGDVLFVFAHQDDEVGIATRIAYEVRAGNRVWCAYLTDGAQAAPEEVRDAESLRALRRLGVPPERIAFLRDAAGRIGDGALIGSLARARAMLRAWLASAGVRPTRVFAPDWEGGHQDHDAAHLLARDAGGAELYAYPLYNAFRRRKGLFRVASFVPDAAPVVRRPLTLRETLEAVRLVAAYPSQARTWVGIGPAFAARMLARRTERFRRADPARLRALPYEGPMLYETRFGVAAADVLAASAELRAELTGGADRRPRTEPAEHDTPE
jgi:LmbE family N-acetylglucosaminyl deacetylase